MASERHTSLISLDTTASATRQAASARLESRLLLITLCLAIWIAGWASPGQAQTPVPRASIACGGESAHGEVDLDAVFRKLSAVLKRSVLVMSDARPVRYGEAVHASQVGPGRWLVTSLTNGFVRASRLVNLPSGSGSKPKREAVLLEALVQVALAPDLDTDSWLAPAPLEAVIDPWQQETSRP